MIHYQLSFRFEALVAPFSGRISEKEYTSETLTTLVSVSHHMIHYQLSFRFEALVAPFSGRISEKEYTSETLTS